MAGLRGLYGTQPREYPSSFCELIARPSRLVPPSTYLLFAPLDLSINLLSLLYPLCAAPRIPTIVIRPSADLLSCPRGRLSRVTRERLRNELPVEKEAEAEAGAEAEEEEKKDQEETSGGTRGEKESLFVR